eukprot:6185842-Pleurochrysis_carterae.AAC.1
MHGNGLISKYSSGNSGKGGLTAVFTWAREEDVVALVSRRLFEQDVLSEPRLDLKRVVANHLGQAIRRAAGAVHNVPARRQRRAGARGLGRTRVQRRKDTHAHRTA